MYHHIHDKTYRYHRLGHLPVSNFEKQLSFLKKTYGPAVDINDYSSTVDDNIKNASYDILVIGNKNDVNMNLLDKLGKVKEMDVDYLFNYDTNLEKDQL